MPGVLVEPDDICLYVTEGCNSNCIMCPMSNAARKRGLSISDDEWGKILEIIPEHTDHITITGGEPFLIYKKLIPLMGKINEFFPETKILILTNGRALSLRFIMDQLEGVITSQYQFAIPIHADNSELHDAITQVPGSFAQTEMGIRALSRTRAKIEIRVVGSKKNLDHLNMTFEHIVDSDYRVSVINLIAMEMTGSAARNRSGLWVDYQSVYNMSKEGIRYAVEHGIDVGLYNFPLCSIPQNAWQLSKDSISDWKIRYMKECDSCYLRTVCGGIFYSVYELGLFHPNPYRKD